MNHPLAAADREKFVGGLLQWFAAAMRLLPWRGTYDPYGVWISEIMLQQTQMERGVEYFREWMRRFPDIRSVADADEEAILSAWEGLGYYSRARNLHAAARRIVSEHGGEFPRSPEAIRALPGIGEYTAGAIAAIAFNQPQPAIDANVTRIFARVCDIDSPPSEKSAKAAIDGTVRALLPLAPPRLIVQALMELGALICGKSPRCGDCPVREFCAARRLGLTAERPLKAAKKAYAVIETTAGIVRRGNRVFIRKRPPEGLWAGLWEFPGGPPGAGEPPERAVVRHIRAETGLPATVREKIGVARHGYTTNRVAVHGYLCGLSGEIGPLLHPAVETAWAGIGELRRYAFPAGHRKLLERLGWK